MDVYRSEWRADARVKRTTVDLAAFPDLVVMYLGLSLRSPRGLLTILKFLRRIRAAVKAKPDGLLLHEIVYFFPLTFGMRQYWRDFDSLETWAGTPPHRLWWKEYLKDTNGTGLWHETYFMNGGIEAIYDNVGAPTGLTRFADVVPAEGSLFNARMRARYARRREAYAQSGKERPVVVLGVGDVERASQLYAALLATTPTIHTPDYVELAPRGAPALGLHARDAFARNTGHPLSPAAGAGATSATSLHLRLANTTVAAQAILRHGGRELSPLQERHWGERAAFYADVDGNVIALAQAEAPPGESPPNA